jgi:hypothetical protein
MKKVALVILALSILGAGLYLRQEWGHIDFQPSAKDWNPPLAAAPVQTALPRQPCTRHNPLRMPFFGDLHVHTSVSFDARATDMLATVDDAYRFARGEEVGLAPFNADGKGQRKTRLRRALDFAAVTDHAEWIGEVVNCSEPGSPGFGSESCLAYRDRLLDERERFMQIMGFRDRREDICGEDKRWCREALKNAWEINQQASENHYDRSADCTFTAFHGYEYSNSVSLSKVHRNVIFRNEIVPELPVSSLEEPDVVRLWEKMDSLCNNSGGDCEAIAIPHNPNVSNDRMFTVPYRDQSPTEQYRQASLRARLEPVVEMMQIKGESECSSGLWNVFGEDELCDFEKMRLGNDPKVEDCQDDYSRGAIAGEGCQSRLDFARYALIEGMVEEQRIGVNPYRFGMAGSTDTHNGTPGDVEEDSFSGCCGEKDDSTAERLDPAPTFAGRPKTARNPGGLMGIWAEENSRDSLFDAMQRREVFATSGPRIIPRFFAGPGIPLNACEGDVAGAGYQGGTTMGGVLENRQENSPVFIAAAAGDPEGGLLQRLQVIKVWHEKDQVFHQAVYDIAGNRVNGAGVDLTNCETHGPGEMQLCATWQDPDFKPDQAAAYYVRVVENPSCRWSWHECLTLPEDERPATCSDPDIPKVIQERAWTSPIWYAP